MSRCSIRVLWQSGAIQPIDRTRIRHWDEINPLTRQGRLTNDAKLGAGDAPHKLLFIQPDGQLGSRATDQVSFLPYVHNVDSFGYDASVIPRGVPYETESWASLLDERWAGRVAIVNEPTIGLFDLALAVQAKGLMTFDNIGDMTRAELDRLFAVLDEYRSGGHFRGVWSSVPASVQLMEKGEAMPSIPTLDRNDEIGRMIQAAQVFSDKNAETQQLLERSEQLTAYLGSKASALEESNQELDNFAYVASRDLKSPLRGIQNLASWVRSNHVSTRKFSRCISV